MGNPIISGGDGPSEVVSQSDVAMSDRIHWAYGEAERIVGRKPITPMPYVEMPSVERVASDISTFWGDTTITPVLIPGSLDSANAVLQAAYKTAMGSWQKQFDEVFNRLMGSKQ